MFVLKKGYFLFSRLQLASFAKCEKGSLSLEHAVPLQFTSQLICFFIFMKEIMLRHILPYLLPVFCGNRYSKLISACSNKHYFVLNILVDIV